MAGIAAVRARVWTGRTANPSREWETETRSLGKGILDGAASVTLDGVRAQEIKESLAADVEEELGHAKQLADRIKELYGVVPGSEGFGAEQSYLRDGRRALAARPSVRRGARPNPRLESVA